MLRVGKAYYCATSDDVNLIMTFLEKTGFTWKSGSALRSKFQTAPIIYHIMTNKRIYCSSSPGAVDIQAATHVSQVRNKIISEIRRV